MASPGQTPEPRTSGAPPASFAGPRPEGTGGDTRIGKKRNGARQ